MQQQQLMHCQAPQLLTQRQQQAQTPAVKQQQQQGRQGSQGCQGVYADQLAKQQQVL
jgi:hypothetical protein